MSWYFADNIGNIIQEIAGYVLCMDQTGNVRLKVKVSRNMKCRRRGIKKLNSIPTDGSGWSTPTLDCVIPLYMCLERSQCQSGQTRRRDDPLP